MNCYVQGSSVSIKQYAIPLSSQATESNYTCMFPRLAKVYGTVGARITPVSLGTRLRLWYPETGNSFVVR